MDIINKKTYKSTFFYGNMVKNGMAIKNFIGFSFILVGGAIVSFTPYKGLGGIIIAVGIAISTGLIIK